MEDRNERRRHRSRSPSRDSEDLYRQRRRRERDSRDDRDKGRDRRDSGRKDRYDEVDRRDSGRKDRYDEADRRRRRSRSPTEDRRAGLRDRSPRHRARDGTLSEPRGQNADRAGRGGGEAEKQVGARKSGPLPSQADTFSMMKDPSTALVRSGDKPVEEKQKPNFAPTGVLAAASNTIAKADGTSIVLKYHEPAEARKPPARDQWKLFVFKGADIVDTIELSLRSCWLVGREQAVVDLPAEHPSISKQHAVIQFRFIEKRNEYGDKLGRVKPYLIDLESANGTMLNGEPIPGSRYLELRDKDMIQFGDSTREYVLMLPPKD